MRDRVVMGVWRKIPWALLLVLALVASACSGAGGGGGGGGSAGGKTTITVATVANPQMQDIEKLSSNFEKDHPNVHVNFVILPENELRDRVTLARTVDDTFRALLPLWLATYSGPD